MLSSIILNSYLLIFDIISIVAFGYFVAEYIYSKKIKDPVNNFAENLNQSFRENPSWRDAIIIFGMLLTVWLIYPLTVMAMIPTPLVTFGGLAVIIAMTITMFDKFLPVKIVKAEATTTYRLLINHGCPMILSVAHINYVYQGIRAYIGG